MPGVDQGLLTSTARPLCPEMCPREPGLVPPEPNARSQRLIPQLPNGPNFRGRSVPLEPQTGATSRPSGLIGRRVHTHDDVLLVAQCAFQHFGNDPVGDAKTEGDSS